MSDLEKVTYTPAEFAEVFGKERTWAYRQLYAGKVKAISEFGRTLIPRSEVNRLLEAAGRYLGAGKITEKGKAVQTSGVKPPMAKPGKKPGLQSEPATKRRTSFSGSSATRQSAYERLTKKKK